MFTDIFRITPDGHQDTYSRQLPPKQKECQLHLEMYTKQFFIYFYFSYLDLRMYENGKKSVE